MSDKSTIQSRLSSLRSYLAYLALIGIGGFFGAIVRYLVSTSAAPLVSTLMVNIAGSFLLGLLMYANEYTGRFSPKTRYFAATGFFGSFTTFSTFAVQSFSLPVGILVINVGLNLILCLLVVFAARSVVIALTGPIHDVRNGR